MQIYRRQIFSILILPLLASFVTQENNPCEAVFQVCFDTSENMRTHTEKAKSFLMAYYSRLKETRNIASFSLFFDFYDTVDEKYFENENELKSILDELEIYGEFLRTRNSFYNFD